MRDSYFLKSNLRTPQVTWVSQKGETCRKSVSLSNQELGANLQTSSLGQVLTVDRVQCGPNEPSVPTVQNS